MKRILLVAVFAALPALALAQTVQSYALVNPQGYVDAIVQWDGMMTDAPRGLVSGEIAVPVGASGAQWRWSYNRSTGVFTAP